MAAKSSAVTDFDNLCVLHAWALPAGETGVDRDAVFYDHYEGAYADYSEQFGLLQLSAYLPDTDPTSAARSLIDDMERRLVIRVIELDHDLVTADDIRHRVRPAALLVLEGLTDARGRAGFPAPLGRLRGGLAVWEWAAVNVWLRDHGFGDPETPLTHDQIADINTWLATRST